MCLLLQKLCVELLFEIVSCLPPHDLRACRQTCKRLSGLIEGSPLLQYMISRANSCVVDVPSLIAPVDSRLDALRRWERAWERLSVHTLVRDLRGPGGGGGGEVPHYEICDGFLVGVDISRTPGYYYRPIFGAPPVPQEEEERGWTRVDFSSRGSLLAVVFSMEHDLTVVVSHPDRSLGETMAHLRLLNFRTGAAHPLAANSTIPIMTLDVFDTGLQVQAEFIRNGDAILIQMSTNQAWNAHDVAFCQWYLTEWRTGRTVRIKKNGGDGTDSTPYGESFAVVAPDIIAVLHSQPDMLVLCRVPSTDDTDPTLTPLCHLALPALRSGLRHLPMRFDTDGTSLGTCKRGRDRAGGGYSRLPFANDTAQGVIRLTMLVTTMEGYRALRWSFALSRKALLLAATGAEAAEGVVAWGEWGSRAAYVFQEEFGWGKVKCAGQRWVWLIADGRSGAASEPSTLLVRDFNVFRAKRAHSEIAEGNGPSADDRHDAIRAVLGTSAVAVHSKSVLANAYFAEDVTSGLPYYETAATQEHTFRPCRQILTDGEHLLGFVYDPVGGGPSSIDLVVVE